MKRYFYALLALCMLSMPALAAQVTITQEGAFDATVRKQINRNFEAGRTTIRICGDGTTINNNTIYYGPSQVVAASATLVGTVCDTTAAGNATEATADAPAYDSLAYRVVGLDCHTTDPGASGVSFTFRVAAAATSPSLTCTVANTKLDCQAPTTSATSVDVAAGAAVDIAAASAGNQGTTPFYCDVMITY